MFSWVLSIDEFLRRGGRFAESPPPDTSARQLFWLQVMMIVFGGAMYGAIMGSYSGFEGDGWKQALLSAAKVPVLFFVTFLLCLPPFYVSNALAGLHADFPRALHALLGFQALASLVLGALGPITALLNVSTADYGFIVLWNGLMFAVASLLGHWRLRELYRPLIAHHPRHRLLARFWTVLYWFVAIQMAWVLRPFVGDPKRAFQIVRPAAWGNAYVEVAHLLGRAVGW